MPFAAALSEHPVAADAVGEVIGAIVEQRGVEPDLVVVFASAAHVEFLGEISAAVRNVLRPQTLLGASASAVLAGPHEAEDGPALAVWAAWGVACRPMRLAAGPVHDDGDGPAVVIGGVPADVAPGSTLLLLADPASFPAEGFLAQLAEVRPDLTVVGGLVSGAGAPGGNALVLDDEVHRHGAVGVALPPTQAVVSQGCRPIGDPMTVTRAEPGRTGHFLLELAGKPALQQLTDLAEALPADDRALLARGVQIGVALDEHRLELGRGDFLVRSLLGADRERGVLAVGTPIPVGTTVQFHVRDADSADEDLRELLDGVDGAGALLFTCNGRGESLFGVEDHDAEVVADALGTQAVAGMFCAGELGPIGGRSFLHGFTASVLVFQD
ncbi:MAG: FIST N-terminal domain-containing protein [Acidimicrobiia bacterium]